MPSYPRACPKCDVLTEEEGFAVDRHAAAGRKSHCKVCDRARRNAYYDAHKDEWNAERQAAREAAWQAELKELEVKHRKRVAAASKAHEAGVRRQAKLLRELGVPDLSPRRSPREPERHEGAMSAMRWPGGIRNSPPFRKRPGAVPARADPARA